MIERTNGIGCDECMNGGSTYMQRSMDMLFDPFQCIQTVTLSIFFNIGLCLAHSELIIRQP
jgi:hypothetical protein